MAEAEQTEPSDKITPTPHRRPHYQNQNRPGTSYRGRGRANASVSKALHLFGVRDLREILNRKHQDEEEQTKNGPPPDPSYNYLKDSLRENANEYQNNRYYKERTSGDTYSRGHNFRGSRARGRGGGTFRENRQQASEKSSFIQNPVNIKVEVVASTGERNCQLDEETKIADIKRIPNYKLKDLRPRNECVTGKDFNDKYRNERGRGRGQRSWRGRGRGERGRGRGRGRYTNRNNENDQSQQQTIDENTAKEYIGPTPVTNEENHEEERENRGGGENHEEEGENHEEDFTEEYQEQYYEDEEEYSEGHEQNQFLDQAAGQADTKLEENLVITSSENNEKNKRTVKFKLDDKQSSQAVKQEVKNMKKGVEKECSEKKQNKNPDK